MISGIQRIYSYIAGSGLTIYGREYYHAPSKSWYIVGDCSEHKALIEALIKNNNFSIELGQLLKQKKRSLK